MDIWEVFWSMFVFFMWFLYIWIFITIFADIFRRHDMGGGAKAGWIILLIFLPLLGMLIYMIKRPKALAQDQEMMEQAQAKQHRAAGYSSADEIAKAQALRERRDHRGKFQALKPALARPGAWVRADRSREGRPAYRRPAFSRAPYSASAPSASVT
jgi:type VI protein secretion system component VasK